MKVKQLIKILEQANPEDLVVLSRDPEGNGYMKVDEVSINSYNYNEGEIGLRQLSEAQKEKGFTDEDVMEGKSCVVVWP